MTDIDIDELRARHIGDRTDNNVIADCLNLSVGTLRALLDEHERLKAELSALRSEAFTLAAGQCIVPNGLLGDEGGSQYCAVQRQLDELRSAQQWRGIESAPRQRFELWFFRECNEGTRRHLYRLFEMPMDEIRNEGHERMVFKHIINHIAAPIPATGDGQ